MMNDLVCNNNSCTDIRCLISLTKRNCILMKRKIKKEKTFDTVKVFRTIKEKIAKETEKMTFEQFKEYLNKNKLKTSK